MDELLKTKGGYSMSEKLDLTEVQHPPIHIGDTALGGFNPVVEYAGAVDALTLGGGDKDSEDESDSHKYPRPAQAPVEFLGFDQLPQ
jgi:hypothetical protein